ncbi:Hint domain-containing protein [uncultured Roseobacter sp.]|uniref:Hint domain-containing protein n=1 Tax=uncultured Roseobacter sp. TaxID=114847 RepID=UPI002609283E|nr:Hint domain-containing protein [uncultured Roseobacter sp.]
MTSEGDAGREQQGTAAMYGWNVNVSVERAPVPEQGFSHGVIAGSRVASVSGWRRVEELAVGDALLTFDNGPQRIQRLRRARLWGDPAAVPRPSWPTVMPAGALGHAEEIVLLPEQGVLLQTEAATDPMGDPFAVVPALALAGFCRSDRARPDRPVEVVTLQFARDEVIFTEAGLMLHCPRRSAPPADFGIAEPPLYRVATPDEALEILARTDSVGAALVRRAADVPDAEAAADVA